MNRIQRTIQALSRENGFTLTELLLASVLLIGLLGVAGAMITVVVRTQPRIAERSHQIQEGRAMIERITRELREGSGIQGQTATGLSFVTFVRTQECGVSAPQPPADVPAIECRVTYACTAGACTRAEAPPAGTPSGPAVTVVDGLRSSPTVPVFSYSPSTNPRHVTVTLEYPSNESGESITLSDGAVLRNAGPTT